MLITVDVTTIGIFQKGAAGRIGAVKIRMTLDEIEIGARIDGSIQESDLKMYR